MKYSEISSKKRADLLAMLAERKEELRVHSFSFGQSSTERPVSKVKKEIARIKTALQASQDNAQ